MLGGLARDFARAGLRPGIWGRIEADRFAWAGRVADAGEARAKAREIQRIATANLAGLPARTAYVVCPHEAGTGEKARAAVREALEAARSVPDGLVGYDGGLMEGNAAAAPSASYEARHRAVSRVLADPGAVHSVFQPIVHLGTLDIVGYEALSRVEAEPRRGPDQWIHEASEVGLGIEFEAHCIRTALAVYNSLPPGVYVSVNASPQLVLDDGFTTLFPEGDLSWLLVEITEHHEVDDYAQLGARLDGLRARGARIAVDDVGAGHSTLRHVMQMSPDYAKLDRSLVQGIDGDPARRALVKSMVAFAHDVGLTLVSEGVETRAEYDELRGLGMQLGQGYLFQRPTSALIRALPPNVHEAVQGKIVDAPSDVVAESSRAA